MASPNAPSKLVFDNTGDEFVPRDVEFIEGSITSLPTNLRLELMQFCRVNKTRDLPIAKTEWTHHQALYFSQKGRPRKLGVRDTREVLLAGRFRYGSGKQLLVVQAQPASNWEGNRARFIVADPKGGYSSLYKIWRLQPDLTTIPDSDSTVMFFSRKPAQNTAPPSSPLIEGSEQLPVDLTYATSDEERNSRSRVRKEKDVVAGPAARQPTATVPRLAFNNQERQDTVPTSRPFDDMNDGSDSDIPLMVLKKRRTAEGSKNVAFGARVIAKATTSLFRKIFQGDVSSDSSSDAEMEPIRTPTRERPIDVPLRLSPKPAGQAKSSRMFVSDARYFTVTPPGSIKSIPFRDSPDPAVDPENQTPPITNEVEPDTEVEEPPPRPYRPGYKIEQARVNFISQKGEIVRVKPWSMCDSLDKIFRQANAADIINQESEKLTVEVDGEFINLVRGIDEDFDDLRVMMIDARAKEVMVRRGNRTIR
jgi:hypothetical protein